VCNNQVDWAGFRRCGRGRPRRSRRATRRESRKVPRR
jgi:hypothetical protein